MKEIYSFIYNIFILLKVACPILSVVFIIIWFAQFFNTNLYEYWTNYVQAFIYIANSFGDFIFDFRSTTADLTCIVIAAALIVLHYIFGFLAARVVDIYTMEENRTVYKKTFDEKRVNVDIKRDLNKELGKYKNFALLLEVILSPTYAMASDKDSDFKKIKAKFYQELTNNLFTKHRSLQGQQIGEKLILTCDEYANFDTFITNFTDEIKKFGISNIQNDISTEFLISIDALKMETPLKEKEAFLNKINSFNYRNKIVTTSAFKVKYEMNPEKKFRMDPLGISRFFEPNGQYTDFDLFSIKVRRNRIE